MLKKNIMQRNCPVCKIPLVETKLHGQQIDRCPKCKGIFFDKGELESIIHIVELFQSVSINEKEIDTVSSTEKERNFLCPHDNITMKKEEIAGLTIDICPKCTGIWLDGGEITALKTSENHIKRNLNLYIRLGL